MSLAAKAAVALLLLPLGVTACEPGSFGLPDDVNIEIEDDISLNDGDSHQISVSVTDDEGAPISVAISWTSSNPEVASVSGNGIVTAHRPGVAVVTAKSGAISRDVDVTVLQVPVALHYVAGNDQVGQELAPLPIQPTVQLVDRHDAPVPGVLVRFAVTGGGGSVNAASVTTDASGRASTTWTLGPGGPQSLRSTALRPAHVESIPDSTVNFTASAVEDEPPPPPPVVSGTASASPGNAQVTLSATSASGGRAPYTYQWHGGTSDPGSSPGAATMLSGLTSRSATHAGLSNGTTYYYRLVVTDADGTRAVSNVASAMPAAPALVVGTATATPGNSQNSLTATAASGGRPPYSYQWHGGTSDPGQSPGSGTALPGLTSLTAVHSGLTNGTTYRYRLVVTDADGTRAVSNATSATPSAPSNAQTLLHETWANGINTNRWNDGYRSEHHAVVQDPTGSGRGQVLRATHTDNGGASHLAFWAYGSGQTNPTGELFIRTWIYVPSNFDGSDYAKMLIIKGNRTDNLYSSFGQAGNSSNGTNFFESYVSYGAPNHSDDGLHFYTYHVDMPGSYGEIDYTRAGTAAQLRPSTGSWHKFEFWLKQNTVGQSNGEQRVWVDDNLVLEWTGLRFRTSNILQANCIALTFSSSNNQGQVWYVDDVYVFDRLPAGMSGW